jgi:hypothetical protein
MKFLKGLGFYVCIPISLAGWLIIVLAIYGLARLIGG